jgi:hypothetical protein
MKFERDIKLHTQEAEQETLNKIYPKQLIPRHMRVELL